MAVIQNLWNKYIWESRAVNLENPRVPINGFTLDQVLGGNVSSSGRSISYEGANTISAVWRAIQIKSGIPSALPFQVFKRTDKGRITLKPSDHPVAAMTAGMMNRKYSKPVFFERSMEHFEGWGNHIGLASFNGIGRAEKIDLIHPRDVEMFETPNDVAYKIKGEAFSSDRVIHVPNKGDGLWGKSTITAAREDLALQMDTRDFGVQTMSMGGIPVGLFIPQGKVTDVQRAEMENAWGKAKAKNKAVAMPFGWEWKQISMSPEDVAFIENNQFGITTVARWFGVPPHKLADLGRATFNNIEHSAIEFLQDTMTPIATKYESAYNTKLFNLPSEEDLYLEFNMDAYIRADSVAKAEAFSKYIQNAIKTPNEVRKYNNDESLDGGDELYIQSATVPLSMIKQIMLSKTPAQRTSLRKKIEKQLSDGIDPQLIIEGLFHTNGNGKH